MLGVDLRNPEFEPAAPVEQASIARRSSVIAPARAELAFSARLPDHAHELPDDVLKRLGLPIQLLAGRRALLGARRVVLSHLVHLDDRSSHLLNPPRLFLAA